MKTDTAVTPEQAQKTEALAAVAELAKAINGVVEGHSIGETLDAMAEVVGMGLHNIAKQVGPQATQEVLEAFMQGCKAAIFARVMADLAKGLKPLEKQGVAIIVDEHSAVAARKAN